MEDTDPDAAQTFPGLLLQHARERGGRPAIREKDYGIWQTSTWSQAAEEVRLLACGLAALGFRRGDNLAIVGDNRPRLYWAMTAAQALGGVPVPLYQDAVAEEMVYVLNDANVRFAIVEDQEQVDKLLEMKARCPALEHVVYDDPRGMRHYGEPFLHDYEKIRAGGLALDRERPDFFRGEVAQGRSDDVAVVLYTSGTTGRPKGVCQTHRAFIAAARGGCGFDRLDAREDILSYLPMAWVGDHLFSYAQALTAAFTINCPESAETVRTDMREIRFYRSIGVNLKQLYGSTETCAYVCLQPDGEIKFDSVGKPAPGVEVRIADNGEVVVDRDERQNDRMTLRCETAGAGGDRLAAAIAGSIRAVCNLRGEVSFDSPGSLPNDGKVIDDVRKYE